MRVRSWQTGMLCSRPFSGRTQRGYTHSGWQVSPRSTVRSLPPLQSKEPWSGWHAESFCSQSILDQALSKRKPSSSEFKAHPLNGGLDEKGNSKQGEPTGLGKRETEEGVSATPTPRDSNSLKNTVHTEK